MVLKTPVSYWRSMNPLMYLYPPVGWCGACWRLDVLWAVIQLEPCEIFKSYPFVACVIRVDYTSVALCFQYYFSKLINALTLTVEQVNTLKAVQNCSIVRNVPPLQTYDVSLNKHFLVVPDLPDGDLFGTPITLPFSIFEVVVLRGVNLPACVHVFVQYSNLQLSGSGNYLSVLRI